MLEMLSPAIGSGQSSLVRMREEETSPLKPWLSVDNLSFGSLDRVEDTKNTSGECFPDSQSSLTGCL